MSDALPRGRFISFEGPEGSGKSLQARRLAERIAAAGLRVLLTHEPGGTPVGDEIRSVLLGLSTGGLSARGEALLMCAARAQLVQEVIEPGLQRGDIVITDRFADSTLAYQGFGRGLPIEALQNLIHFTIRDLTPDLTLLLDLPVEQGLERKRRQETTLHNAWTRFEAEDLSFHERVRSGYLELGQGDRTRWARINADQAPDEVGESIWSTVCQRLGLGPAYTE